MSIEASSIFDETRCKLGEGPMWHPLRKQFFWFDIDGHRLFMRDGDALKTWEFGQYVSAAGWIDAETLLVANDKDLTRFSIETGARESVCPLEADNPATRCNDGRADPHGGFWIGTMALDHGEGAGAIYRYYRGELRRIYANISIPNAQCFAVDGSFLLWADTPKGIVWKQRLDSAHGWPDGEPEVFLDLPGESYRPDGAVIDADGNFWCAHHRHGKVTCHAPDGTETLSLAAPQTFVTCPAFGGEDMKSMIVTSADRGAADDEAGGMTAILSPGATGHPEPKVIL